VTLEIYGADRPPCGELTPSRSVEVATRRWMGPAALWEGTRRGRSGPRRAASSKMSAASRRIIAAPERVSGILGGRSGDTIGPWSATWPAMRLCLAGWRPDAIVVASAEPACWCFPMQGGGQMPSMRSLQSACAFPREVVARGCRCARLQSPCACASPCRGVARCRRCGVCAVHVLPCRVVASGRSCGVCGVHVLARSLAGWLPDADILARSPAGRWQIPSRQWADMARRHPSLPGGKVHIPYEARQGESGAPQTR
jgi:hypothetical protein